MEPNCYERLDGQTALVTGGNRGIGREIVRGLVDLDATVFAGVRDPEADVPDGATPVQLDVTEDETLRRAVDEVVSTAGGLDVLVNNAGVGGGDAPLPDLGLDHVDRTLDVDLRGPILLTRHALPHLLESETGRVVNVSSGLAKLADPIPGDHTVYRAAKAGLNGLTVGIDATHGDDGLIANSVDPGWVATDLGGEEAPRTPAEGAETPVWLCRFGPGSPSGRFWKDRQQIEF